MSDKTICHGLDAELYQKLERIAAKEGVTPDEYCVRLMREALIEKTRPRGAGKIRMIGEGLKRD